MDMNTAFDLEVTPRRRRWSDLFHVVAHDHGPRWWTGGSGEDALKSDKPARKSKGAPWLPP